MDKLKKCTVLTIAHRIRTIVNYDKIMIIENGNLIDFDTPKNLLSNSGLFNNIIKESGNDYYNQIKNLIINN